jgi:hypothetical protein
VQLAAEAAAGAPQRLPVLPPLRRPRGGGRGRWSRPPCGPPSRCAYEPLGLLLPIRQAGLFRWCLEAKLRPVKPMVLMSTGEYREPQGAWFPSVLY